MRSLRNHSRQRVALGPDQRHAVRPHKHDGAADHEAGIEAGERRRRCLATLPDEGREEPGRGKSRFDCEQRVALRAGVSSLTTAWLIR